MCITWNIIVTPVMNLTLPRKQRKKKQRKIPPLDLPMCQQLWWLDAGHHRSTCDHRTTRILGPANWGYPWPTYGGAREGLGLEK